MTGLLFAVLLAQNFDDIASHGGIEMDFARGSVNTGGGRRMSVKR